jgi:inhibitor of KinA sporulation pathway (predicted exonuclease)
MDKKQYLPKKITRFLAVDLELNQPSNSIIQIGACAGDIETGEVLDRFSMIVNCGEQLGYCNGGENDGTTITDLTGITQEQVDNGVTLLHAYEELSAFAKRYGTFVNPLTWGGGDTEEIRKQVLQHIAYPRTLEWPFGRRWIDVKTLFVSWRFANGEQIKGGLARSMTKVGLKFEGRKHDAEDDAVNTFRMYVKLLELLRNK